MFVCILLPAREYARTAASYTFSLTMRDEDLLLWASQLPRFEKALIDAGFSNQGLVFLAFTWHTQPRQLLCAAFGKAVFCQSVAYLACRDSSRPLSAWCSFVLLEGRPETPAGLDVEISAEGVCLASSQSSCWKHQFPPPQKKKNERKKKKKTQIPSQFCGSIG